MEEKYPIKFSLGQFILLLGVEVVVLALVFLLGARFGGTLFQPMNGSSAAASAYQSLDPNSQKTASSRNSSSLNENSEEGEMIGAAQEGENLGQLQNGEESEEKTNVGSHLNTFDSGIEKNTMVRFKSSGNTKFAVEISRFFDEVLASHEITKLREKGLEPYLEIIEGDSGETTFSVRMGSFGDRRLAEQYAARISNEKGLELRIVQVN